MALRMRDHLASALPELRYQPTPKRVRARLGAQLVADSTQAVLVWEPRRVVASYAVPAADVAAALVPAPATGPDGDPAADRAAQRPLLDPRVPFRVHTAAGESLTVDAGGQSRPGAAYRLDDDVLAGYLLLDFDAFGWWEEDEQVIGHARDPYHRIDVRRSSRVVRVEHGGDVLAESNRSRMLFEADFPVPRYYLPVGDVRVELLPGTARSVCAYKGRAAHYSARAGGDHLPDIAWSYEDPLEDAVPVRSLVSFYQERLDLVIDGRPVPRPVTPWS